LVRRSKEIQDNLTVLLFPAGEVLSLAEPWIEKGVHPHVIINGYVKALEDCLQAIEKCSVTVDTSNRAEMVKVISSCIGTKLIGRWSELMCGLALDAVSIVTVDDGGQREIDIKRYARVEKVCRDSPTHFLL
jgi:T-complex protein 1 subunit gamma